MKYLLSRELFSALLVALFSLFLVTDGGAQPPFVRLYGDPQENAFNKVIPQGAGYFALGSQAGQATVSFINLSGQWQWTLGINIPSVFTDAVLMPTTGELLFVGHTLPLNAQTQSLMGKVDVFGQGLSVIAYDTPGVEAFTRVTDNPGGTTFSVLGFHAPSGQEEVVLVQVNTNATITAKDRLAGPDSRFTNDLVRYGNNGHLIAGAFGSTGVIYHTSLTGAFVNGVMESDPYTFQDVLVYGNTILAAMNSTTGAAPRIVQFDANFFPLWDMEFQGVDFIHQIEELAGGKFYAVASRAAGGLIPRVLIRFDINTSSWDWARYIRYNETVYTGGHMAPLLLGNIAFVDGRAN
ncbi:MAG: hypothetical protein KDC54_16310, partial [Lewinella sp.]|nr:hypothetical protein [Lewinella sp.]